MSAMTADLADLAARRLAAVAPEPPPPAAPPPPVRPARTRPPRRRRGRPEYLDAVPTPTLKMALPARRRAAPGRDKRASRRSQTGTYVENPVFLDVLRRMIRAAGRRVSAMDIELIGDLDRLLREEREAAVGAAWWALLRRGFSSEEIAARLGVKKQSAFERFARFRPEDLPVGGKHDPRAIRPAAEDSSSDEDEGS